jgi:hypothetical protein
MGKVNGTIFRHLIPPKIVKFPFVKSLHSCFKEENLMQNRMQTLNEWNLDYFWRYSRRNIVTLALVEIFVTITRTRLASARI